MPKVGKDVLSKRPKHKLSERVRAKLRRVDIVESFPYFNEYGKRFRVEKAPPSAWYPKGGVRIMTVDQGPAFSYKAKPGDLSKVKADALKVTQGKMSWETFYKKWQFSS